MQKILLLIALATVLSAGVLTGTEIRGTKTYCYYSDGMGICPATR